MEQLPPRSLAAAKFLEREPLDQPALFYRRKLEQGLRYSPQVAGACVAKLREHGFLRTQEPEAECELPPPPPVE